jgi:hypothetical protein
MSFRESGFHGPSEFDHVQAIVSVKRTLGDAREVGPGRNDALG